MQIMDMNIGDVGWTEPNAVWRESKSTSVWVNPHIYASVVRGYPTDIKIVRSSLTRFTVFTTNVEIRHEPHWARLHVDLFPPETDPKVEKLQAVIDEADGLLKRASEVLVKLGAAIGEARRDG